MATLASCGVRFPAEALPARLLLLTEAMSAGNVRPETMFSPDAGFRRRFWLTLRVVEVGTAILSWVGTYVAYSVDSVVIIRVPQMIVLPLGLAAFAHAWVRRE